MHEFITNFLQYYPFSLTDTLAMIPTLILGIQYLVKGQWDKLKTQAETLGLQMYESVQTDKQKRDAVLNKVSESVPTIMKPLIKDGQLGKMIDLVYVTQIKPKAKAAEMVKGEPPVEQNRIGTIALDIAGDVLDKVLDEVQINFVQ